MPLPSFAKVLGRNFTFYSKSHAGTRNAKVFPLPVFAAARTLEGAKDGCSHPGMGNQWVKKNALGAQPEPPSV